MNNLVQIKLEEGAQVPKKFYEGDAGYDLFVNEDVYVHPGSTISIGTGVYIALPPNVWVRIMPRSSTLRMHGVQIVEAVIDNGYRGEMFIQATNPGNNAVRIRRGARLAQMIPHEIVSLEWNVANELTHTDREDHGFGSTGR